MSDFPSSFILHHRIPTKSSNSDHYYRFYNNNKMNKFLISTILFICSLATFAQDSTTNKLKALLDSKQYDKVIENYSTNATHYTAKSLYYIGFAYYMKEDDANCIKLMQLSIAKDSKDPAPHYIKATTLNYMHKYEEAIKNFQTAISLNAADAEFYSGLGDSYYNLKNYELALESYKKATEQTKLFARPFLMIGQIYSDLKDNDNALKAYYNARSNIPKTSDSYPNILFNIGLLESLKKNYKEAELAFLELIELNPGDYHSYAKLIQIYFYRKDYEKAIPYKEKLYSAYKKGLLQDNMKDMFCFDQFEINNKLIQAFERYEEGNKSTIYNKHLFYIVDKEGEIDYRIQTEFSLISVELGGPKYILCATMGNTHVNYGLGFNDNFKYDDLKKAVVAVIEGKIKPSATTKPSK